MFEAPYTSSGTVSTAPTPSTLMEKENLEALREKRARGKAGALSKNWESNPRRSKAI